ncbi:hypothetical protein GYMLUDRAFT_64186 [Collybiopsis luxurians FD-317 M1]|uniref:Unplaced genomic scaffold GYMLUscaffold_93, whole genome shotgun sequence n=1 Tax=Collybiopsis luxurians FD-317 M1 TaxID=944289 RepID=A0A0D0C424_9AGAR|nr:hypothetical protein GYMLUDRAFT_64186 [Collybiopsis luxurians FD-317 M1]
MAELDINSEAKPTLFDLIHIAQQISLGEVKCFTNDVPAERQDRLENSISMTMSQRVTKATLNGSITGSDSMQEVRVGGEGRTAGVSDLAEVCSRGLEKGSPHTSGIYVSQGCSILALRIISFYTAWLSQDMSVPQIGHLTDTEMRKGLAEICHCLNQLDPNDEELLDHLLVQHQKIRIRRAAALTAAEGAIRLYLYSFVQSCDVELTPERQQLIWKVARKYAPGSVAFPEKAFLNLSGFLEAHQKLRVDWAADMANIVGAVSEEGWNNSFYKTAIKLYQVVSAFFWPGCFDGGHSRSYSLHPSFLFLRFKLRVVSDGTHLMRCSDGGQAYPIQMEAIACTVQTAPILQVVLTEAASCPIRRITSMPHSLFALFNQDYCSKLPSSSIFTRSPAMLGPRRGAHSRNARCVPANLGAATQNVAPPPPYSADPTPGEGLMNVHAPPVPAPATTPVTMPAASTSVDAVQHPALNASNDAAQGKCHSNAQSDIDDSIRKVIAKVYLPEWEKKVLELHTYFNGNIAVKGGGQNLTDF